MAKVRMLNPPVRRNVPIGSRLGALVCALVAATTWTLVDAHFAASASDLPPALTLTPRNLGDQACPYRKHDGTFEKAISIEAAFDAVYFLQRFTLPSNSFLEQYCVAFTVDGPPRDVAAEVVVYAPDGAGGDPGTLLARIPFSLHAKSAPEATGCAVNVGLWTNAGGSYWAGVSFDPDGEVFLPVDNSPATPQQPLRISSDGLAWGDLTQATAVRALGVSYSKVVLGAPGDWFSSGQIGMDTPLEVATARFRPQDAPKNVKHLTGVVLEDTRLAIGAWDPADPLATMRSVDVPRKGMHFAFTEPFRRPDGRLSSASVAAGDGDYDVFEVSWNPKLLSFDLSHERAFGLEGSRFVEVDAFKLDRDPHLAALDFDGAGFELHRWGATQWQERVRIDVPGLLGAANGASRSRWQPGIGQKGSAIGFYSVENGQTYDLEAGIYDGQTWHGGVKFVMGLPQQAAPGEARLINLPGTDGKGGSDFPVYLWTDRGDLNAAVHEWRGSRLEHRATVKIGEVPMGEFSNLAVAPGASYSDLLVVHPDRFGKGALTRLLLADPRNSLSYAVQQGAAPPGFDGAFPYAYSQSTRRVISKQQPAWVAMAKRQFQGPGSLNGAALVPNVVPCLKSDEGLCLGGRRFRVTASFRTEAGEVGDGKAVELTPDTGYFWFFDPANVELVVKLLDACGTQFNRYWVFAAGLTDVEVDLTVTDAVTGAIRTYENALKTPFQPVQDTGAFGTCDVGAAAGAVGIASRSALGAEGFGSAGAVWGGSTPALPLAAAPFAVTGRADLPKWMIDSVRVADLRDRSAAPSLVPREGDCLPSATTLCLNGGRFQVEVEWMTAQGEMGAGQSVPLTDDTGYFWFFNQDNVEIVLKVLDACNSSFNRFWVFAAGLTDVEVAITVTDTETDTVNVYENPLRTPFQPIQDTGAFATCP